MSDAPMRRLLLVLLAACGGQTVPVTPVTPVTPVPPVAVDRITSWMMRIPAACRVAPPIPDLTCPAPLPVPPDACIVEQRDLETDTVVDRLVFDRGRLLRADTTSSSNQQSSNVYDYDRLGRLIRKTTCIASSCGEPTWAPRWRQPMVRHDGPTSSVDLEERLYATSGAQVPMFGRAVRSTRYDGKVESTDMRLCYAFDTRGRRTERYQVYRMSHRPEAFDSVIHSYDHGDRDAAPSTRSKAGARSMTASTLNLDRRADGSLVIRYEMSWTAHFTYDHRGLLTSSGTEGSQTRLRYDDDGRLINYAGVTVAWNQHRIVAITGLGQDYDRAYRYDAAGRLIDVRYGPKQGYRVVYGPSCARDFVHAAIAPNIDNFLHYEGKNTL